MVRSSGYSVANVSNLAKSAVAMSMAVAMDPSNLQCNGTSVNDFCRLCKGILRIKGNLSNTKKIYDDDKSIFKRLQAIGVTLHPHSNKSKRICVKCFRLIQKMEESLSTLQKWKLSEDTQQDTSTPAEEQRGRQLSPSESPTTLKRKRSRSPTPIHTQTLTQTLTQTQTQTTAGGAEDGTSSTLPTRKSRTEVIIQYPSRHTRLLCHPSVAGIVEHIAKGNWSSAANLLMQHDVLLNKIKEVVLILLDKECKRLCRSHHDFMLWRCSPEDLREFSFAQMESDIQRLAPFMFSVLSTITNQSHLHTCAAASIALRGRNPSLSAFAYYINSVLQYGGANKAVFQRLCKFGISTNHHNAIQKQHMLAEKWGEKLY